MIGVYLRFVSSHFRASPTHQCSKWKADLKTVDGNTTPCVFSLCAHFIISCQKILTQKARVAKVTMDLCFLVMYHLVFPINRHIRAPPHLDPLVHPGKTSRKSEHDPETKCQGTVYLEQARLGICVIEAGGIDSGGVWLQLSEAAAQPHLKHGENPQQRKISACKTCRHISCIFISYDFLRFLRSGFWDAWKQLLCIFQDVDCLET